MTSVHREAIIKRDKMSKSVAQQSGSARHKNIRAYSFVLFYLFPDTYRGVSDFRINGNMRLAQDVNTLGGCDEFHDTEIKRIQE